MAGGLFTGVYSGMIIACADATVPPGWLVCDGTQQDMTTYSDLFSAIGHSYNGGVAPGNNKFVLPNLSNRFPRGAASISSAGGYSGSASHDHTLVPTLGVSGGQVTGGSHGHSPSAGYNITGGGDHSHTANFGAMNAGGGVNSAIQTANSGQSLSDTAKHHTHPALGGVATNNSGNHNHSGVGGGNVVDGGTHTHSATASNPTITVVSGSNDPQHHIVQYMIKT